MFAIIMAVFVLILVGPFMLALTCTILVGTLELCNKMLLALDRMFSPRDRNTYVHIENQYVYHAPQSAALQPLPRSEEREQFNRFTNPRPQFNRFGDLIPEDETWTQRCKRNWSKM